MHSIKRPLLIALMASLSAGTPAYAQEAKLAKDPLNLPAPKAPKASVTLMLGASTAGTRLVAAGDRGIIIVSNDDGANWQQANVPVSVTLTAIRFVNASLGWAVGHDGVVLNTVDGGLNWTRQLDGNGINPQMLAAAKAKADAVQAAADAAPAKSKEQAMEKLDNAMRLMDDTEAGTRFGPSRPLLDVWFKNESTGYVVGAYGQLLKTTDGGKSWNYIGSGIDNFESLHYNALTGTQDGRVVVVGEQGRVYLSRDEGANWKELPTGYRGHLYGALAMKNQAGADVLLAYGFKGNIFRLEGNGTQWQPIDSGSKESLVGSFVTPAGFIVLVDQVGRLIVSVDQGKTFVEFMKTGLPAVTGLAFNANQGKVALPGKGGVKVFDFAKQKQ
jgi:photosystem II stability/assembly factor-like uncharacterized protein